MTLEFVAYKQGDLSVMSGGWKSLSSEGNKGGVVNAFAVTDMDIVKSLVEIRLETRTGI